VAVHAQALVQLLTAERLRSYLRVADGDQERALALYDWNTAATGAVSELVGMVEVLVRNALDAQLTSWAKTTGADCWFDAVPLDRQGKADIVKARDRATERGREAEKHGKVIAELSFGFWRYMTGQKYLASLWAPALHQAFPLGPRDIRKRRVLVEQAMISLHTVRNRAAHHEPIHRRDLLRDYNSAVRLASYISRDAAAWVQSQARLPAVINTKPEWAT